MGEKYIILGITTVVVLLGIPIGCFGSEEQTLAGFSVQPISMNNWVKHIGNPVMNEGRIGTWRYQPADPFVMKDEGVYKMWFGANDEEQGITQIGYAESRDGITWEIHPESVLRPGTSAAYDATVVETPTVVKDENGTYHMWYSSVNKFGGEGDEAIYRIGHATSPDGFQWTKDRNNPVIRPGDFSQNKWNSWGVLEPTVIREDGIYKMWFDGLVADAPDYQTAHHRLGYATSKDGSEWEVNKDPILELCVGAATKVLNSAFFVMQKGDTYELWYLGGECPDVYAISKDGIQWTKSEVSILPRGIAGQWDSWIISSPTVILDEGKYKMWYSGAKADDAGLHHAIGYAEISAPPSTPTPIPTSPPVTPSTPSGSDTTPPSTVTNLTVPSVTANSAIIVWTAPGDDSTVGTATSYDLRFSTAVIADASWSTATQGTGEPTPALSGISQGFALTGLTPGTTYWVALTAHDEAGNTSGLSNAAQFTTAAAPSDAGGGGSPLLPAPQGVRLVRSRDGPHVYAVRSVAGTLRRHWVPSLAVFTSYRYDWNVVQSIPSAELLRYPRVSLLRAFDEPKVYYLTESGLKRHIPNERVFLSYGNRWEDVVEVGAAELEAIPENMLIFRPGDPRIYKLEEGRKRWIVNPDAFRRAGLEWSKIAPVNQVELDAYSVGADIR